MKNHDFSVRNKNSGPGGQPASKYNAETESSSRQGVQRDVVYLGWSIAPSCKSRNAGGGMSGKLRGLSHWVQLYTGAQINFGDLTQYLTYSLDKDISSPLQERKNLYAGYQSLTDIPQLPEIREE